MVMVVAWLVEPLFEALVTAVGYSGRTRCQPWVTGWPLTLDTPSGTLVLPLGSSRKVVSASFPRDLYDPVLLDDWHQAVILERGFHDDLDVGEAVGAAHGLDGRPVLAHPVSMSLGVLQDLVDRYAGRSRSSPELFLVGIPDMVVAGSHRRAAFHLKVVLVGRCRIWWLGWAHTSADGCDLVPTFGLHQFGVTEPVAIEVEKLESRCPWHFVVVVHLR